jgi:ketosteroid isomerase-like protein
MLTPIRRRTAVWSIGVTLAVYVVLAVSLTVLPSLTHSWSQSGSIHVSAVGLFAVNNVEAKDSPRPAPVEKPSNDPTKEIQELLDDQVVAWNKGNLDRFMEGYWNSPDLSFYSGRDKKKGWKETRDRYYARYKKDGREMGTLTFSELAFDPLNTGSMMVRGRWKLALSKEKLDGLFTLIVQKKPEGWRIVHDHTSVGEPETKP